jgi:hypothetical protein
MHSEMASANASVASPFFTWPQENLHRGPWKHFPNTLFQHKNNWPVGWQYWGRVGRSVKCFPGDIKISNKPTKLLYRLRYGSIRSLIFGRRVSSFVCVDVVGAVGGGAGAGVAHWVGGGPVGGPPNGNPDVAWDIHSRGNIARWIGIALRTESVIPSRCKVKKWNVDPGVKSNTTGFCPKNKCL